MPGIGPKEYHAVINTGYNQGTTFGACFYEESILSNKPNIGTARVLQILNNDKCFDLWWWNLIYKLSFYTIVQ